MAQVLRRAGGFFVRPVPEWSCALMVVLLLVVNAALTALLNFIGWVMWQQKLIIDWFMAHCLE